MSKDQPKTKILQKPIWISIFVLLSIIIIFTSASWVLYNHTINLLTENLRERLLTISITVAANINSNDIEALQVKEDWKKPEWAKVVNRLHNAKYNNKDVVFMYIFRQKKNNSMEMEFVTDADSIDPYANTSGDPSRFVDVNRDGKIEPDGPDKLQWPGQDYPEAADIPEAFTAYNGPLTNKDLYADDYGTVLTGYAPIKDEYGNTVAVLATDIKADDFFTITRQTLYPFLIFISFLISVIIIFNTLLIISIKKEVEQREEISKMAEDVRRAYETEKMANKELANLDKIKNQFVQTTQHDLRTPLTSIMGYSDLLLNGTFGKQNKKTVEVIKKLQIVTQNMIRKINDFLDTTQFQLGKNPVSLKPDVQLGPILDEIASELQFKAESKGIYLKLGKPKKDFAINADREKLKAALFNVVDNSIKYTPKGGVDIKVENDISVKIIVSDTGIGISPENLKTLFSRMFQRDEQAKEVSVLGSGIGLYLATQIIKAHNGKIWAESEGEGEGSTFYIELPVSFANNSAKSPNI